MSPKCHVIWGHPLKNIRLTYNEEGKIITSIKKIKADDLIFSRFHDGKVTSKVIKKEDN